MVTCIFHEDRSPSLSIDLDAQVFRCHGCGEQGGFKRFAELVGEHVQRPVRDDYLSPLDEARREALARERAADARRAQYRVQWRAADEYRMSMRLVLDARKLAQGPWTVHTEEMLSLAAQVESDAEAALAEASDA